MEQQYRSAIFTSMDARGKFRPVSQKHTVDWFTHSFSAASRWVKPAFSLAAMNAFAKLTLSLPFFG